MRRLILGALLSLGCAPAAFPHPGGLDAKGCHNDRKNGGYHCHRGARSKASHAAPNDYRSRPSTKGVHYRNCAAARAAGAAPIRVGEPGYRRALDRDGDGIACE
ncbi:excalibur calcium-binding domain-containing protein [Paracoccus sp. (in: a-proteobacteria)]|uniref:excalibur calcium-binding domain-containing protein n=1 Tax=Paracoccus sp. TaxID=267 RepID=UPI00289D2E1B|nr:excalibur calcium-binding domain-containing protein [Paracoccus sp. (in: a-proteobacteria)]